jgi:hypothetical protein
VPLLASVLMLLAAAFASSHAAAAAERDPRIAAMQAGERGPFQRIRWFCADGSLLPPEPDACKPHGGGAQHGEWSETTLALRAAGYRIANVYADLEVEALLAEPHAMHALAQMAIERFLIRVDDGWILRKARYYRGAFQIEGERRGALALLERLASRAEYAGPRFPLLRTLTALLPHGNDTPSARAVRQAASALVGKAPG